jgi:hypothetical protein
MSGLMMVKPDEELREELLQDEEQQQHEEDVAAAAGRPQRKGKGQPAGKGNTHAGEEYGAARRSADGRTPEGV